jgi:hypothetical protein
MFDAQRGVSGKPEWFVAAEMTMSSLTVAAMTTID